MTLQLDLFGEIEADEIRRYRDALTCLAYAHPSTLEILIGNRRPDTGEVKQGLSGDWAYSVRRDGFFFQDRAAWGAAAGAWYRKPADHMTWTELHQLIDDDPHLDEIRTWSESLTAIDAWRDRGRPFELWPNPERWHPSYISGDHERLGWVERLDAWQMAIAICTDAREAL